MRNCIMGNIWQVLLWFSLDIHADYVIFRDTASQRTEIMPHVKKIETEHSVSKQEAFASKDHQEIPNNIMYFTL